MNIIIRNGHVLDPRQGIDGVQSVYVAQGRIAGLGQCPAGFHADLSLDATGCYVSPGFIDLCARLREPGLESKADIASETTAAARSGITTLCVPPDTDPVIDTPAVAELIRRQAQNTGKARLLTVGALTQKLAGEQLAEMGALKEAGCIGVSNALQPIVNTLTLRRAMEYAATHDLTVFINPMDWHLSQLGCAHEGVVSTRLGLPGIPEAAETIAVARALFLIEYTGVRAHFHHISTARAVAMLKQAQQEGLAVSADTTAHHLHLTEIDLMNFSGHCHVVPPLRSLRDRDGLRQGVAQGVLSCISSDHQPHEPDVKLLPFSETAPGISALETLLPLSLRLVQEKLLSLNTAIASLTSNPAKVLNRSDIGSLGVGQWADICVFDPAMDWTLSTENMLSRGKNSPFLGWQFNGGVRYTLFQGKVVYQAPSLE